MEKILELSQRMEEAVRLSNYVIFHRGRSILNELGISNAQFGALLVLYEYGPLTMGELCKHLITACSTATDLADRMEREGLVERVRDSKDRRVIRMHLLDKGQKVVAAVIKERHYFFQKVLLEYGEEERIRILEGMERFVERMKALDEVTEVQRQE